MCALILWTQMAGAFVVSVDGDSQTFVYGGTDYAYLDSTIDRDTVYLWDARDGQRRSVWKNETYVQDIKASPAGDLVGFLEGNREAGTRNLVLITVEGDLLRRIVGVQRYTWSPDGREIGYITGPSGEDYPGFRTTGVWVYELASDTSTQVYARGYEVNWAEFDGNLYIWEPSPNQGLVHQYDPRTRTLHETVYQGIFFSPDGKYVYCPNYEGSVFRLFLTGSNEDVTGQWAFLAFRADFGSASGWLAPHTLVFPSGRFDDVTDCLLSLDSGVVRRTSGNVIAYMPGTQRLFVLTHDAVTEQPIESLPIVPPEVVDPSLPPADAGEANLHYQLIGEVPLAGIPERIHFSSSGRHFSLGSRNTFTAVYTASDGNALYVKKLPGTGGRWHAGDTLYVRIPGTRRTTVVLPAYDEIPDIQDRLGDDAGAVSTAERLAVAAWAYCQDASFEVTQPGGERIFETAEELSGLSEQYFGEAPLRIDRATSRTLGQEAVAADIYFLGQSGERVLEERDLGRAVKQIFMVDGASKVEITPPGARRDWVSSFTFDPSTKRVCARGSRNTTVYDALTGERRVLPSYDEETRTAILIRPIPGQDYLLVAMKPRGPYVGPWFEVWSLDGGRLATIPTGVEGAVGFPEMDKAAVSEHLLVVALSVPVGEGVPRPYRHLLRVFRAVQSP